MMQPDNPWKIALLVVVLLFFAGMGIAHVINPDRFLRNSGFRRGGEMLEGWNRFGVRMFGVVCTAFAIYVLYDVLHGILW
jgi:hypothetical protein